MKVLKNKYGMTVLNHMISLKQKIQALRDDS